MSKNLAIKIDNVSKMYDLGQVGTGTLSKDLNRTFAKLRGKPDPYATMAEINDRTQASKSGVVWALKDINFEVEQGEVLGIIGRNGAGKSTLLKILSQITAPTTGTVKYNGRLASLLEVGTGMHPEMSARENIFLNGSIMGMTRQEIKNKFDDIVDFAGVTKFVDTPIKRFSSGMKVRLGFAVAAFLEPEILVVDEVLAVGDAEFQKRAIGKMKEVSQGGDRTVLFVSHNMGSVKSLCTKSLVLKNGQLNYSGNTEDAIKHYLHDNTNSGKSQYVKYDNYDYQNFKFESISIYSDKGDKGEVLDEFDTIYIETIIDMKVPPDKYHLVYVIKDEMNIPLFTFSNRKAGVKLKEGYNKLVCKFPKGFLNIGNYTLSPYLIHNKRTAAFHKEDLIGFQIHYGKREVGSWSGREPGFIKPKLDWTNE